MKKFLFVAGIVFVITLGVVMGTRMSPDALAVVIGIICGVLASIPTSAMLVWVMRQRDKQVEMQMGQLRPFGGQYPPVVVVNGQGTQGYASPFAPSLPMGAPPPPMSGRQFKVIGQENTESVGDVLPHLWDE
jgi:hypothetical protein